MNEWICVSRLTESLSILTCSCTTIIHTTYSLHPSFPFTTQHACWACPRFHAQVSATSQFHEEALRNDLQPLSAAQTHRHSGDYPCELINVKVFFLRAGNFWPSYITFTREQLIAPWSNHDLKSKKKGHALRNLLFGEIYDTTSTDSVTHSKSTFIAQQPSNLLACSRSNLSLLFIKCVTVNCRVLSEWQFNFHCLHYWLPLLSNVAMMVHHHLSIGDIFIHNNISARRVNVRPL